VTTLESAELNESDHTGFRRNLCMEMKMLHAIHLAVNGTKMGIIQVPDSNHETSLPVEIPIGTNIICQNPYYRYTITRTKLHM
jgi:hypothetical protein